MTSWHQKGTHPVAYRVSGNEADISWEQTRHLLHTPPAGIRSGLPLGNMGTGTIELRADGSLANWQIFNNSPGDATKIHVDEAFFAIRMSRPRTAPEAYTIRTHPPAALPASENLRYAGAMPVARLRLPQYRSGIRGTLYAYGMPVDQSGLNTPAIVFTFLLSNRSADPVTTSLMFNLPNVLEGTFRTERGLILSKSGSDAMAGELCVGIASRLPASSMVSTELDDIWNAFANREGFGNASSLGLFDYGALSTEFVLEPGANRSLSFVLSWRFPNRLIAGKQVGNRYSSTFPSASQVNDTVVSQLPQSWDGMVSWDRLWNESSLPGSVQQGVRSSLNQLVNTTFCASDERWRSWDAYADADLSSMALMPYRALPMLCIDANMLKSVLRGYAVTQETDGRIAQTLGRGAQREMDQPPVSSSVEPNAIFLMLAYLHLLYTGDENFTKELWPHLVKALDWQLTITSPEGLPTQMPAQSDWQELERSDKIDLQTSALHLVGLESMRRMAQAINRDADASGLVDLIDTGTDSFNDNLAASINAGVDASPITSEAAPRDLLAGIVWAGMLGYENMFAREVISEWLASIEKQNTPAIRLGKSDFSTALWPAMAMNWASASVQADQNPSNALNLLDRLYKHIQGTLNDTWGHFERLSLPDGLPLSTPNHASHLAIWPFLLSLSGQRYNAKESKLYFNPKLGPGTRLPFFTPEATGLLSIQKSGRYIIEVISGRLEVSLLEVGENIVYRDMLIEKGQAVQLSP